MRDVECRSLRAYTCRGVAPNPEKPAGSVDGRGWDLGGEAGHLQEKGTLQRLVQRANGVVGVLAEFGFSFSLY